MGDKEERWHVAVCDWCLGVQTLDRIMVFWKLISFSRVEVKLQKEGIALWVYDDDAYSNGNWSRKRREKNSLFFSWYNENWKFNSLFFLSDSFVYMKTSKQIKQPSY